MIKIDLALRPNLGVDYSFLKVGRPHELFLTRSRLRFLSVVVETFKFFQADELIEETGASW